MTRFQTAIVLALLSTVAVGATSAAPRTIPPRIVSAAMQDVDRDGRADRVRLVYSARIRHAADRDGRYPFTVAGYKLGPVGAASGKTLVIRLAERAQSDADAQPRVRYRRTRSKPVTSRAGVQARAQTLLARAHRFTPRVSPPPAEPPPPPAEPPPPQPAADGDRDGTPDARDCRPGDAAIHPGAPDQPDLALVDSNCDGIDGDEQDAIFAAPTGDDANPGTKARPKRQIEAATAAAAASGKTQVLAAIGPYGGVHVARGIGIYGGYDPATWTRRGAAASAGVTSATTQITGAPEGILADGDVGVVLQLLSVHGAPGERNAYGIRAVNGSRLVLQRVTVTAGNASAGVAGSAGRAGASGQSGGRGRLGSCDGEVQLPGGRGGASPGGRPGGGGGASGQGNGAAGETGAGGTPGGAGGAFGNPGGPGRNGRRGADGDAGTAQGGGAGSTQAATTAWAGRDGREGTIGGPGNGGGGGGGGGGQFGVTVDDGSGASGGGGGGGGAGGGGGQGGGWGGGSFGIYLHVSTVVADGSSIRAGDGGAGGPGGDGGRGGEGGAGGQGGRVTCPDEIGRGGDGGNGGNGGPGGGGGGGAGGPSIGVFTVGGSTVTLRSTTVAHGAAGRGGDGGGPGRRDPGQTGIAARIHPPQ
jgi:hypothetical protein